MFYKYFFTYNGFDLIGYTLDSMAGAWPQQVKFTLPRHLFIHLGFPSVHVVSSVTFIPGFVVIIWTNDI